MSTTMTRHQVRTSILMLVFENIFRDDETIENIIEIAKEAENFPVNEEIELTFIELSKNRIDIDQEISKYLKDWTLSRISKISLAILRVAFYEILFSDKIETDSAISEAVLLAENYSLDTDVKFINGVLSSFAKSKN